MIDLYKIMQIKVGRILISGFVILLVAAAAVMVFGTGNSRFVIDQDHLQATNPSFIHDLHDALTRNRRLLLTFDDGPAGQGIDQRLVDTLTKHGAHAIFFINCVHLYDRNGKALADRIAAINYMINHGDLVENHTFTHAHLLKLSPEAMHNEISRCNNVITQMTGQKPYYFRPPFGETDQTVNSFVESLGMKQVLWNANSYDFMVHDPAGIEKYALFEIGDDSILDMHETYPTSEVLDDLLKKMEHRGYHFVLPVGQPNGHS